MAKKNETVEIELNAIRPLEKKSIVVNIRGLSPLIVHAWSQKAKMEILGKQQKKASKGKEIRNPLQEFVNGLYFLDEHGQRIDIPEELANLDENAKEEDVYAMLDKYQFGFPAVAFKAAMIDGAFRQGMISKKTTAKGAIRILQEYAVINGKPRMREDMVKIGGMTKVADLRYRPEFAEWSTTLIIEYLENSISIEQILAMLNTGGFCEGVGEWRSSRDGDFGSFEVAL